MSLEDEQLNLASEIEALKAIYVSELEVKYYECNATLTVQLHPSTADVETEKYVRLSLMLSISKEYPDVAPEVKIQNTRGLSDSDIERIYKDASLKAEESRGSPMLFEIIEVAKECLTTVNTPNCSCAICLYSFNNQDVFTKTECYHYFHSFCLATYILHCKKEWEEENKEVQRIAIEKEFEILCPICRLVITFGSASPQKFPPPKESTNEESFVLTDEMRESQSQNAAIFEKQQSKGGIIDVEAEKNKFLIEISQVPTIHLQLASPAVPTEAEGKKDNEDSYSKNVKRMPHLRNASRHFTEPDVQNSNTKRTGRSTPGQKSRSGISTFDNSPHKKEGSQSGIEVVKEFSADGSNDNFPRVETIDKAADRIKAAPHVKVEDDTRRFSKYANARKKPRRNGKSASIMMQLPSENASYQDVTKNSFHADKVNDFLRSENAIETVNYAENIENDMKAENETFYNTRSKAHFGLIGQLRSHQGEKSENMKVLLDGSCISESKIKEGLKRESFSKQNSRTTKHDCSQSGVVPNRAADVNGIPVLEETETDKQEKLTGNSPSKNRFRSYYRSNRRWYEKQMKCDENRGNIGSSLSCESESQSKEIDHHAGDAPSKNQFSECSEIQIKEHAQNSNNGAKPGKKMERIKKQGARPNGRQDRANKKLYGKNYTCTCRESDCVSCDASKVNPDFSNVNESVDRQFGIDTSTKATHHSTTDGVLCHVDGKGSNVQLSENLECKKCSFSITGNSNRYSADNHPSTIGRRYSKQSNRDSDTVKSSGNQKSDVQINNQNKPPNIQHHDEKRRSSRQSSRENEDLEGNGNETIGYHGNDRNYPSHSEDHDEKVHFDKQQRDSHETGVKQKNDYRWNNRNRPDISRFNAKRQYGKQASHESDKAESSVNRKNDDQSNMPRHENRWYSKQSSHENDKHSRSGKQKVDYHNNSNGQSNNPPQETNRQSSHESDCLQQGVNQNDSQGNKSNRPPPRRERKQYMSKREGQNVESGGTQKVDYRGHNRRGPSDKARHEASEENEQCDKPSSHESGTLKQSGNQKDSHPRNRPPNIPCCEKKRYGKLPSWESDTPVDSGKQNIHYQKNNRKGPTNDSRHEASEENEQHDKQLSDGLQRIGKQQDGFQRNNTDRPPNNPRYEKRRYGKQPSHGTDIRESEKQEVDYQRNNRNDPPDNPRHDESGESQRESDGLERSGNRECGYQRNNRNKPPTGNIPLYDKRYDKQSSRESDTVKSSGKQKVNCQKNNRNDPSDNTRHEGNRQCDKLSRRESDGCDQSGNRESGYQRNNRNRPPNVPWYDRRSYDKQSSLESDILESSGKHKVDYQRISRNDPSDNAQHGESTCENYNQERSESRKDDYQRNRNRSPYIPRYDEKRQHSMGDKQSSREGGKLDCTVKQEIGNQRNSSPSLHDEQHNKGEGIAHLKSDTSTNYSLSTEAKKVHNVEIPEKDFPLYKGGYSKYKHRPNRQCNEQSKPRSDSLENSKNQKKIQKSSRNTASDVSHHSEKCSEGNDMGHPNPYTNNSHSGETKEMRNEQLDDNESNTEQHSKYKSRNNNNNNNRQRNNYRYISSFNRSSAVHDQSKAYNDSAKFVTCDGSNICNTKNVPSHPENLCDVSPRNHSKIRNERFNKNTDSLEVNQREKWVDTVAGPKNKDGSSSTNTINAPSRPENVGNTSPRSDSSFRNEHFNKNTDSLHVNQSEMWANTVTGPRKNDSIAKGEKEYKRNENVIQVGPPLEEPNRCTLKADSGPLDRLVSNLTPQSSFAQEISPEIHQVKVKQSFPNTEKDSASAHMNFQPLSEDQSTGSTTMKQTASEMQQFSHCDLLEPDLHRSSPNKSEKGPKKIQGHFHPPGFPAHTVTKRPPPGFSVQAMNDRPPPGFCPL